MELLVANQSSAQKSFYNEKLSEALTQLKQFDIVKALGLFYEILQQFPTDLEIINQIYRLELRKNNPQDFKKIALHIFTHCQKSSSFHSLVIESYLEFKKNTVKEFENNLTSVQVLNLFFHLGQTGYQQDLLLLLTILKEKHSEDSKTPTALLTYCEQLIQKKQFKLARSELNFLMVYYTEAKTQIPAEKLLSYINSHY